MKTKFFILLTSLMVVMSAAALGIPDENIVTRGGVDIPGDVNNNGQVNIADVNAVINVILEKDSNPRADVNNDGEVTVADVNAVIDIILSGLSPFVEHEYVDLGLPSGTLWATCNVGASTPEEFGNYFAWGETEPKDVYTWETYEWCNGSLDVMTKYCTGSEYGTVDNRRFLVQDDDAAYVNWGPEWCMPSTRQQQELIDHCTWNDTTRNGVRGFLVTGPNGNTLFLPVAGFFHEGSLGLPGVEGVYWSSSLFDYQPQAAYSMILDWGYNTRNYWYYSRRCLGFSVRAVRSLPLYIEQQSLDLGYAPIGATRTGELTIINNIAEDQTLTVTVDEPFLLKQEEDSAASITVVVPGKSSSVVTILFTATEPGEFNGNVTLQNPTLDEGQRIIPVHAQVISGDEYVDLGLPSGTLWATMNVGASSPEDYGDYFAWGETKPQDVYNWNSYKWCYSNSSTLTKYCTASGCGYNGFVDGKTELELEDDAAYVNWGSLWRMPTTEQQQELARECTSTWTTVNGVNGRLFTGPNGNTLFLPAAGYYNECSFKAEGTLGVYWSRTLYDLNPQSAFALGGGSQYFSPSREIYRCYGQSVRAVRVMPLYIGQQSLDLGTVPIDETITGVLTITNNTDEDQTLTVTADAPFSFLMDDNSVSSITIMVSGHSSRGVMVMFTATEPGEFNGNVTFQNPLLEGGQRIVPVHVCVVEHEYVDLGLPSGTLWATTNIGANRPEGYGDYFAWGEIEPKGPDNANTYQWYSDYFTKYCTDSQYGPVDGKTELDLEDDAATMNWGTEWRMPSREQMNELIQNCWWEWTTVNGVNGRLLTGPNGNTLFLPAAGRCENGLSEYWNVWGHYWSRTLCTERNYNAHPLNFNSQTVHTLDGPRSTGNSVRAVRARQGLYIVQQNLEFDEVGMGKSCTRDLTVVNNTTEDQTLTITADEPFLLKQGADSASSITISVPSKSIGTVTVMFTATEPGDFNGNVTFLNSALDGGQSVIPAHAVVIHYDEWVDLGLPSGTLWATCNVGATAPEDVGDYFAWGETEPKEVYTWETYKWCKGAKNMLTKYCTRDDYGSVDDKTELEPEDDAATVNCGESWRTPTMDQLEELFMYCSRQWTTRNGVSGRLFRGSNGNTIFLPAGGFRSGESLEEENIEGFYWSRTLYTGIPSGADCQSFDSKYTTTRLGYSRNYGLSVRPVRVQPIDIQPRSHDFGEITIGKTFTRDLTVINNTAEDQTVTVTADAPFLLKQEEDAAATITIMVPGKSSSTVTVVFTATEVGEFNGNVTFSNPAMDDGQMAIPIRAGAYTNEVPQYVDLGLSSGTLWATCNVGASSPEEYGDYFAWGETEPKEVYSWETYKWCKGSRETITKYCTDSYYGTVDGKTELEPADDAATANWGPEWCMPIVELQQELMESCTWTWTTMNGVNGHLFTGPNGNTMFWPAAGFYTDETLGNAGSFGGYWSSSGGNTTACEMGFNGASLFLNGYWSDRYYGHTVRAVRARPFYFDQPSLELGQLPIGVTRRGQLTIVNMTTDVQTLTVTADAPFSLRQGSGSASSITLEIPGKSSDTVTVMFTATEPGEFNGNITFQNPAMEGGQSVIPVQALAYVKQDDTQHEYVDLGLPSGTLWATCNVGASAPEQYGDYFAWGEAEPKDVYNWTTYHQGTSQDAATVNWGPEWRRPSLEQYQELFNNCSRQWVSMNGVYGKLFTGPNGNSIFVPAAGFCSDDLIFSAGKECYSWLRTPYTSKSAYCMFFSKRSIGYSYWGSCCYGYTVRPVRVSQTSSQSPLLEQQALYPDDESSEEMRFPELTILNHIPGDQELDAHRRYIYIDQPGKE